jgi:cell wall-associated NlpC family hydrolase
VLAPVVVPVTVTVDNAFMRNGPGINYDPITRAEAGLALQVIGKYGDWYQVRERVDTPVFWMAGELLSLPEDAPSTIFDLFDNEIPPPPPPRIAIVRESGLTMRDGPGTNYVAITTLKLNANVELIERYQDWYHIGVENNVDGWVRADFLEVTPDIAKRVITADSIPDPSPELVAIITGDTVNLRRGPDSRHAKLDTVAKGQRLDLIGKYKDWVQVSYNNKKAWVFRELLSVSSHVLRRVPTTSDFPALPVAPVKTKYTNISTSSDVANIALQYVGYRYVWGGTTPKSGFDCSGLMQYAFKQVGVDIPRIAASQFNASNGVQISGIENLAAGDLLFFTGFNSRGRRGITHVSMYLGNGKMVHAMNPSYGIQVSNFFDDFWLRHYYGAVRIRR